MWGASPDSQPVLYLLGQVSVLTDQVEAQGEKIRDRVCLEGHQVKLNAAEEMLQQVRAGEAQGLGSCAAPVREPFWVQVEELPASFPVTTCRDGWTPSLRCLHSRWNHRGGRGRAGLRGITCRAGSTDPGTFSRPGLVRSSPHVTTPTTWDTLANSLWPSSPQFCTALLLPLPYEWHLGFSKVG